MAFPSRGFLVKGGYNVYQKNLICTNLKEANVTEIKIPFFHLFP